MTGRVHVSLLSPSMSTAAVLRSKFDPRETAPELHPIPADIRAALTLEQIVRLENMVVDRRALHAVDYRASTSFCGRHFYLTLFAGPESRSLRRLHAEGQRRTFHRVLAEIAGFCLSMSLLACLMVGATVIVLYVTKSALGIDLLQGHTFLHDYFYWR